MPNPTGLNTLAASREVMARAVDVSICPAAVETMAQSLAAAVVSHNPIAKHWLAGAPDKVQQFLQSLSFGEQALFMLVFHATGFSYWQDPPWSISDDDTTYNGSTAWLICLIREQATLKPALLATLGDDRWHTLTLGVNNIPMPMACERLEILRELGKILQDNNGEKIGVVQRIQNIQQIRRILLTGETGLAAPALALLLAKTMPGFNDISNYDELTVPFLKRAQLLVNDINYLKIKHGMGPISGLDKLTAFADYKIPQFLRHKNVLRYSQPLAEKIDKLVPLSAGSKEEVEIRAGTVVAVEAIRQRLNRTCAMDSGTLDNLLWLEAQKDRAMQPYHRCRTINY